jgi:hypothetical protein
MFSILLGYMSRKWRMANVSDNNFTIVIKLSSNLKGRAFAHKGFINQRAKRGLNTLNFLMAIGLHLFSAIFLEF